MTHILDFKNIRKYKSDLPPSGLVQLSHQRELKGWWLLDVQQYARRADLGYLTGARFSHVMLNRYTTLNHNQAMELFYATFK